MTGESDVEHLGAEFCVFPPDLEFMNCFMHVAGAWAPVVVFVGQHEGKHKGSGMLLESCE